MQLAEAYVTIKTNQVKFGKELKTMESSVKRSVDRMKRNFDRIKIGVAEISRTARYAFLGVTAAIAGSVYAFTKMGDTIHKMSIRTGIAAEDLSALGYAAQISGAELDTVERSLRYLSARMMDADEGLAEAKRGFERLGLSIKDADGNLRSTIDVLKDAADRIAVMTNETEKSALAGEIFGMRYGPMLLPLLEEGGKGITKLMNKAKELGITIDTESAAAAAEFNDRLTDMKGVLAALGREVGEVFLPVFRNTVVVIIDKVKEWRKAIDELTPQQKKLVAQIVLLGTAALGAIGALGMFAKLAAVIKAAGLIIAGTFGLITSPLGLIMIAVGALALAWAHNWGDIQGKTKAAWDFLKPILKKISDWLKGTEEDSKKTAEEVKKGTEKQANAWETFLKVLKVIGLTFKEIFLETGAIIKETLKAMGFDWDEFVDNWKAGIDVIKTWFYKKWEAIKKYWNEFIDNWKAGIEIIKKWVDIKFKWMLEKTGPVWDWMVDFFKNAKGWLKAKFSWLLEKAGAIWDTIIIFFKNAKEWLAAKFSWTLEKIGPIWDAIISFFADAKDWLVKKFSWTLEKAGDVWNWFTETLMPWLWTWAETTFYWLLDLPGRVWDKFRDIMQWVKEHATFAFNWLIIKVGEAWDWLTDALWPWLKEWGVKAFEWGLKLIGDVWNWLKDTLIPWVKEWKKKTFEWTLNLLGDAWEKIQDLIKWLGEIPEKLKPVKEGMQGIGEAAEKIVPPEAISGAEKLHRNLELLEADLKYATKNWRVFSQEQKRAWSAVAAECWLFRDEAMKIARETPVDFAIKFEKAFMSKKSAIQRAILEAIASGDFQRALSLLGVKSAKAFLGRSPGLLTELDEGTKETKKLLNRMLGDMDAMTKKIMIIFRPIIGLFKTIFDAILKIIEKFSPEAAAEIRALVDDVMTIMEGLLDTVIGGLEELPKKTKQSTDKQLSLWQKFCEAVKSSLEKIGEAILNVGSEVKSAFSDAIVSILTGAKTMTQAFSELADTIRKTIIKALIDVAIQAAITGNAVLAVIAGIGAALISLAHNVEETVYYSEKAFLDAIREIEKSMAGLVGSMTAGLMTMAAEVAVEFEKMGMSMSRTIEEAERKLEGLYERQADLQASTREKLISELDKYYDYRMLREMSLDELLALSAETRVKIEEGTIKEVEESEAERERRRKDREINRLKRIEDGYNKESELLRRKIALTEIEIKFLELKIEKEAHGHSARAKQLKAELQQMINAYKQSVEAYEEAEKKKEEATEQTTKTVEKETEKQTKVVKEATEDEAEDVEAATEDMGKSWDDLTADMRQKAEKTFGHSGAVPIALNEAINAMIAKIGELPTEVFFDVIGKLHMPKITAPGPVWFDIFGKYHAPSIPSAQIGIPYVPRTMPVIVHPKEAILNPPQAREWRGETPGKKTIVEQHITIQSLFPPDDSILYDRIWREGMRAAYERDSDRRAA